MKEKARKIAEMILVAGIVALSVAVFLLRDRIQSVGTLGYVGLFLLCFLANATVFLPAPSLMLAASAALVMNPWLVALVASLGSALGEFVGYVFGSATKNLSPKFEKFLEKLRQKVPNDTVLVFVLAVLPLPLFDVVGVYAGGTKMHLVRFFVACFVGKFIKMLVYTRLYDILAWATTLQHTAWQSVLQ